MLSDSKKHVVSTYIIKNNKEIKKNKESKTFKKGVKIVYSKSKDERQQSDAWIVWKLY